MSELETAHHALLRWAEVQPERVFLRQPVNGVLRESTWSEAADTAQRIATALVSFDVEPGDRVAILAKNSAEWILADLAIAMAGLVSVPIYPTASADTVAHVLAHSDAKLVFVGKLDNHEATIAGVAETIPRIAFPYDGITGCQYQWQELVEGNAPIDEIAAPAAGDVMTILYTSGSTGLPKGVVISFGAYEYSSKALAKACAIDGTDRFFSYLPLAHITERACTAGPAIYAGCECSFVESLKTFAQDLQRAKPTFFISVPRLWVKFQSGVHEKIPPTKLRVLLAIPIVKTMIAAKIRQGLGFGSCRMWGSGTAPISPETLKWYRKIGVNIGEGWGMSETAGLSCGNIPFDAKKLGTIGAPMDGVEMKLSEEGEILIRCPGLFSEYYKSPELTREVFTADGFFRTGDKGDWDENINAFAITGRVKDIFKSAKGKYVTPVPIESKLSGNSLVEQVCVMGSGLPAPVAAVVLSDVAKSMPTDELKQNLNETLEAVNSILESHEKMSNLLVVRDEWTTENGLLTPTLKLKRSEIEARYATLISQPFAETVTWEA